MGLAQVCGLQRGFECDCGGIEQLTLLDHCHGPHTSACHDDEPAHEHHDDEEDAEDRHDHTPNIEELLSTGTANDHAFSVPVVVLTFLDVVEPVLPQRDEFVVRPDLPEQRSCYPPWPVQLAHEIELRV